MRASFWRRATIVPVATLSLLSVGPHASADDPFFTSEDLMITLDRSEHVERDRDHQ